MTSTLPLPVQTINANHPGSSFGVVLFEESDAQMSFGECCALLSGDGWSNLQEIPSHQVGIRKLLVSRRK
jgi:hypothetical protein